MTLNWFTIFWCIFYHVVRYIFFANNFINFDIAARTFRRYHLMYQCRIIDMHITKHACLISISLAPSIDHFSAHYCFPLNSTSRSLFAALELLKKLNPITNNFIARNFSRFQFSFRNFRGQRNGIRIIITIAHYPLEFHPANSARKDSPIAYQYDELE